jgi:hypothetical protein
MGPILQPPLNLILQVAEAQLEAERTKEAIERLEEIAAAIGRTVEKRVRLLAAEGTGRLAGPPDETE